MKKNKIVIIALVVLFIVSVVSVGMNIKKASEQDRVRRILINHSYSALMSISRNLDGLIYNIENDVTDYETNRQSLTMIAQYFVRLDTLLKQYSIEFPPKGIVRNVYPGTPFDFDYIAYTLTAGTGSANDMRYSGILVDGVISENEIRYLTILRDDIDLVIAAMVSTENPPNENQNLTSTQIDNILITFFEKWSYHSENSPYFLLRSELRSMKLDDVRAIADGIGPDLTMGDLRDFTVDDLGDGLYGYRVIGGLAPYNLLVASDDMQTVRYTKFYDALSGGLLGDTSETIDIRYYDIDKFIADGTQEIIHPLP